MSFPSTFSPPTYMLISISLSFLPSQMSFLSFLISPFVLFGNLSYFWNLLFVNPFSLQPDLLTRYFLSSWTPFLHPMNVHKSLPPFDSLPWLLPRSSHHYPISLFLLSSELLKKRVYTQCVFTQLLITCDFGPQCIFETTLPKVISVLLCS